jgi:hypothetical protein
MAAQMPGTIGIPLHPAMSVKVVMAIMKNRMVPPAVPDREDKT